MEIIFNYMLFFIYKVLDIFLSSIVLIFCSPLFVCIFLTSFTLFFLKYNVSNLLKTLILIEVILLSLSFGFVVLSVFLTIISGHIFAFFILALAGCESALGLALLVLFFRNRGLNTTFENLSMLKG